MYYSRIISILVIVLLLKVIFNIGTPPAVAGLSESGVVKVRVVNNSWQPIPIYSIAK